MTETANAGLKESLTEPLTSLLTSARALSNDLTTAAHRGRLAKIVSCAERMATVLKTLPAGEPEETAAQSPEWGRSDVTARMFGAAPLAERAPAEYPQFISRYARLLELTLDRRTYKTGEDTFTAELRAMAERLGELRAGPREVATIHATALREASHRLSSTRAHALVVEGRMLSFELMGYLLSFYRRRATFSASSAPQDGRNG